MATATNKKPRGRPLPVRSAPKPDKAPSTKPGKEFADDSMTEIMERADEAYRKELHNIEAAYEDLAFLAGEGNQWTDAAKARRKNRPMMEINQCPKFVRQVTGDFRRSRPAIKIVPIDGRAQKHVGDIIAGMIRYIENRSEAKAAYNIAGDQMGGCGVGALRITQEYAEETTFNNELRIVQVEDAVSVLWDTDAILPTREDAMWCLVPVDLSERKFKAKYPDIPVSDFNSYDQRFTSFWTNAGTIRVAEYFEKRATVRLLAMHKDGSIEDLTDAEPDVIAAAKAKGAKVSKRDGFKVWRSLVTLGHVLEEAEPIPGRYIPIVPMIGEEVRIGRKVIRRGVVRLMKDSQRRYNYNVSQAAEMMGLAPKAPWLGTRKNFEEYEADWAEANDENLPFLTFTPDPANGGAPPSRNAMALGSPALAADTQLCVSEMEEVTGIYRSALGARSNETSGVAIKARDAQTDTGNTAYMDNYSMSVRHVAKILVDRIPLTYDTERMVMILDERGDAQTATVNKAVASAHVPDEPEEQLDVGPDDEADDPIDVGDQDEADEGAETIAEEGAEIGDNVTEDAADESAGVDQDPDGTLQDDQGPERDPHATYINDLTIGSYAVVFDNGPSFATKEDEASEGMAELIKAAPEIAPLILDLYAKQQHWPMAGEIAKRLEMMLPPPIQAMIARERAEKDARMNGRPMPGQGPPGMPGAPPGPGMPPGGPGAPMPGAGPPQPPGPTPLDMLNAQTEAAKAQSAAHVADINLKIKQIDLQIRQLELSAAQGAASPGGMSPDVLRGLVEEIAHLHGMVAEIIATIHAPIADTATDPSATEGQTS